MLTPNSTWNAYCKCDRIAQVHKYYTQSYMKFQLDKQCENKYRTGGTALPASVCSNFAVFILVFSNLNICKCSTFYCRGLIIFLFICTCKQ